MKQIVIGDVLSAAWELTKKSWIAVLVSVIGLGIIDYVLSAILGPSTFDQLQFQQNLMNHSDDPQYIISALADLYGKAIPSSTIVKIVSLALSAGFFQTLLNCIRGKYDFTIDAWKLPINVYAKFLVIQIIASIIAGFGFLLCILPGIYLYARLEYAGYYLLDHQEAGIGEAISASWNMTADNAFTLSLLQIVYFFVNILGICCCCVGVMVTSIITYLASAVCYSILNPSAPASTNSNEQF